jgi:hypothetical protein
MKREYSFDVGSKLLEVSAAACGGDYRRCDWSPRQIVLQARCFIKR